ncbi:RNase A-like domain-containing protein [Thalassiella azotivora]
MEHFAQTYPKLYQLLADFVTIYIEPALDPQLLVDDAISHKLAIGKDLAAELADLDRLLEDVADDEARARAVCQHVFEEWTPPDGPSMVGWLRTQRQLIVDARDGRVTLPAPTDVREREGLRLPRASRFTDEATANAAVTEVLRANEDAFRTWAADPGGCSRQHYYADLGREVGRIQYAKDTPTQPATAVTVVMARHPETGAPFVRNAYPETTLDQTVRERFPDLCHWFGAWFDQDLQDPWRTIADVNRTTTDPARSRVRDQLTDLLTTDDDAELTAAVKALGSYALPTRMRWWVQRTLWRLDAYDWLDADD